MKLINRENGEELVEVGSHKEYASKGVAGTGLGLGIAGTALWLLSGGLNGGLFGNRFGTAGSAALGTESVVEKEDKCELVNGMWQLAFNGQTARFNDRNQINTEIFGIYKSQVDADFNLFRRTCRMITGELVLPNTPTVTGYPSYNPCRVDNSTSTPAA